MGLGSSPVAASATPEAPTPLSSSGSAPLDVRSPCEIRADSRGQGRAPGHQDAPGAEAPMCPGRPTSDPSAAIVARLSMPGPAPPTTGWRLTAPGASSPARGIYRASGAQEPRSAARVTKEGAGAIARRVAQPSSNGCRRSGFEPQARVPGRQLPGVVLNPMPSKAWGGLREILPNLGLEHPRVTRADGLDPTATCPNSPTPRTGPRRSTPACSTIPCRPAARSCGSVVRTRGAAGPAPRSCEDARLTTSRSA